MWAENITRDVYSEYINKYSFWKYGIKVFYSPVTFRPKLMIISYQPGGDEKDYEKEEKKDYEKEDFHLQNFNSYVDTNHLMSRKVRSLFDFNGGLELLKNSVVFPLIFFRSPTISIWKQENPQRDKMEKFSFSKVKEIIDKLQPQKILILGMKTYDELKYILGTAENEKVLHKRGPSNERMALSSKCGGYKLFAITHPTGARINTSDWDSIRKLFEKDINII